MIMHEWYADTHLIPLEAPCSVHLGTGREGGMEEGKGRKRFAEYKSATGDGWENLAENSV